MDRSVRFSRMIARAIACSMLLLVPACQIPHLRNAAPAPDVPPFFSWPVGPGPAGPGGASPEAVPPPANGASTLEVLPPPGAKAEPGPGPELPPAFGVATCSDNSAQLGVIEFFQDPLLTGLIDQAMAGNRELLTLNEEVEVARNEILARRGAYLPFLNYRAHADVTKRSKFTPLGALDEQIEYLPGKNFPDPVPDYLLGLELFWRLDIWRELRNARDAAAQRFIATNERRNYFVTEMVADIAENYYELMALDKRMETLNQIILLQQESLKVARAKLEAGRDTELPVQRFLADVRKNQSEKLIVQQEIVEAENRINFLVNRFPQPVERMSGRFFDLRFPLSTGAPAQLLVNRADIREAERELAAAGLDVQVARAQFFPKLDLTAGVGYEAFDPHYLFWTPQSLIYNVAGDLVGPLINKTAIRAEYMTANARQLQAVYNYQRVVLDAFTEVVNRMSKVENYGRSIDFRRQQIASIEAAVNVANKLFQNARAEYGEVLFSQRDLRDARLVLIDTKRQQLSAIVNAYQALGGGNMLSNAPLP